MALDWGKGEGTPNGQISPKVQTILLTVLSRIVGYFMWLVLR